MNPIIKVNGFTIDARKVGMLDRKTVKVNNEAQTGVVICFAAGGHRWVADPEARAIEQAFMVYDGVQSAEFAL